MILAAQGERKQKPRFASFSPKQKRVLTWWTGPDCDRYDVVICDGAVRSGKTTAVAVSFILWAMESYQDTSFAICGKTVGACSRNVVQPLRSAVAGLYRVRASGNLLELSRGRRKNRFYLFGGKDEGSAALIQGMTLGGVLLDEAALMPRSFVEQAMARCSVEGAKVWMSLNPEGPTHWLYTEWICKAAQKRVLRLHFTMDDNPSLSEKVRVRYRGMYSGVFYRRFVLGEWAAADGLVYPMFSEKLVVRELPEKLGRFVISVDYGTMNPFSAGLWGEAEGKWYRMREFYHNGREKGALTDEEYYHRLEELAGELAVRQVIVDPVGGILYPVYPQPWPVYGAQGKKYGTSPGFGIPPGCLAKDGCCFMKAAGIACGSLRCMSGIKIPGRTSRSRKMTTRWTISVILSRRSRRAGIFLLTN